MNLPEISPMLWWVIALVIFLLLEAVTIQLVSLWFAAGSLVAAIAAGFGADTVVCFALFLCVSAVLLIFTRPMAKKYLDRKKSATNADALIGQCAVVVMPIDNLKAEGQVKVKGQIWTARSEQDEVFFADGDKVEVKAIEGVKLIVAPLPQPR